MHNTAKHTPGPIHNGKPSLGQPCTCCILLRTGEPLESNHGDRPCTDISRIELCPKHAAAPAMYEALKGLLENAPAPKGVKQDFSYILYREAARAALAQAEGQQA